MHRFRGRFGVATLGALILVLSVSSALNAQILNGSISGTVQDPSGAFIAGANVTAVDLATNKEYKTTTTGSGEFVIPQVPFGFFKVTITAHGFSTAVFNRVQVNVSQTAQLNVKMAVQTAGTEVVVEAQQEVVQSESSELKYSIDRNQILNLQLPTRNPLDLVRTMPGMATPSSSTIGDVFVHGLRGNSTNITLDGINIADNFVKTSGFFGINAPTVDSVGEFNVSVGGIGTDAGFGAAQVSIRTQRGSNALHGSAFWFQRTSFLNANSYFNNFANPKIPTPFQLQNRIGFNVGGPVFAPKLYNGKNKTWFFLSFEAFREPLSRTRSRTVLSDPARTGLFTYTPTCTAATCPAGITPGVPNTVNLLTIPRAVGSSPGVIDPDLMNVYNGIVRSANTSAGTGCSPDGLNLLCYTWNIPGKSQQNRYSGRIDHQLTNNHAIEFSYNQQNFNSAPDFLNNAEPFFPGGAGGGQESRRQVFTWALHSTLGNTKTNEARFGLARAPVIFALKENYSQTNRFRLILPTLQNPIYAPGNRPQGRNSPVREWIDNFAWVKGRHTLRFGGEYRQIMANAFADTSTVPAVNIAGAASTPITGATTNPNGLTALPGGSSTGDLRTARIIFNTITGLIGSTTQGFNHTSPDSGYVTGALFTRTPFTHNFAFYGQDGFKLRSNLTLEYGVRWEYQGVYDLRNKLVFAPQSVQDLWGPSRVGGIFQVLQTPAATDSLVNFSGDRNGKSFYEPDYNNFAPFIGFAWDPWNDGKTAIRGGYAIHYTQDGMTFFDNLTSGNDGLSTVLTNGSPAGAFSLASNPLPSQPQDMIPFSYKFDFTGCMTSVTATCNTSNGLWFVDPNIRTPYVQEWNLAVQREIGKRITLEARYVGNHAVKQYRVTDLNQINLTSNPFTNPNTGTSVANALTEFKNAQANLAAFRVANPNCGRTGQPACSFANNGLPGQLPLPLLGFLFASPVPATSGFTSSSFASMLDQNQAGLFYDTIRRSKTYFPNLFAANFPLNYFVANPWTWNALLANNGSWSNYDALEVELRRRFSSGLYFDVNYSWSNGFSDQRFLSSQSEFQAYRDISNPKLDKYRSTLVQGHTVSASFIYPLPIGRSQAIGTNMHPALDKLMGGWSIQGLTRVATGSPFSITTSRLPTGMANLTAETAVLRNMTVNQLKEFIGVFKTPAGVLWLDPKSGLLTVSGTSTSAVTCTAGQTSPCFDFAGAGEQGNLRFLDFTGPRFFNQDFSVIKRTSIPSISEQFNFEIRLEAFNAFNHPNFANPTTAGSQIDGSSFGKLTDLLDTSRGGGVNARVVQWALRINF